MAAVWQHVFDLFEQRTTTGTSSVVRPTHRQDNQGGTHVGNLQGGTFTVRVEGRMADDAPWAIVETFTNADLSGQDGAVKTHVILPQMRANVTAITGGAEVSVYLAD